MEPTYNINTFYYLCTKFGGNWIEIATCRAVTQTHTHTHTHTQTHTNTHTQRNMTPRSLGLIVKNWQPKVGLAGYDILFANFVV